MTVRLTKEIHAPLRSGASVLAVLAAFSGGTALAQDANDGASASQGLERIVVTAQRVEQDLQSIPIAISAFTGEELQARGIFETSDLMGSLPNLQVTSAYSTTQPNFSLRGVSVANEFSAATASPVGVYVDEVYQSFRASHGQQLYDLERVEVLRGPQGTLYGRNTTGGAINFITIKPSLEGHSGYLTVGGGNFGLRRAQAALEVTPIEGVLGIRASGIYAENNGYTFNPTLREDFAQIDSVAARINVRFEPFENFRADLKAYIAENTPRQDLPYGIGYLEGRTDAGGYSRFAPRPELGGRRLEEDEVQADTAGEYFTASQGLSLKLEYGLDNWTFTSITGYDLAEYRLAPFDCDGSPNNVCAIRYYSESINFNQELRATYTGDRFQVIGGVYYGKDDIYTENEPDFFGFLRPLLLGAGLPGEFGNVAIAETNSLAVIPAFAADPTLTPGDPGFCDPITINPGGFFDGRSLIAFNADVQANNTPGGFPGEAQAACAAAGAPPFGPILANQQFSIVRPSVAIFGEATYDVTDRFSLTLGVRYTYDEVRLEGARTKVFALDGTTPLATTVPYSFPFDPDVGRISESDSTGEFTGRIIADYQVTDDIMVYASYSRGYRAGTFNALAYQDVSQVYFVEPETVNAYEVGFKSRLFDNRVQLNVAGFYYDYSNQQIAQIVGATSFLRSADGELYGAEAELVAQVTDWLAVNAALGVLESEYSGNAVDPSDPSNLTLDINGNQFPNAPDLTFSAGVDVTLWERDDKALILNAQAQYMGEYFFDPFGSYGQDPCDQPAPGFNVLQATPELACGNPSYWLANARLTFEAEHYALSLWGRNLTDEFYYVYGLNLNAFYQDYLTRGAPRTYGGEITVRF